MADDKMNQAQMPLAHDDGSTILPISLHQEMKQSFLEYSMSVIVSRALPDVRDGLKPVHRRILYAMSESGLTPNKPYKKSAWTVGEVIGKFHPHGDQAVYNTMVRMAQDFSMSMPLVDGHGNFGSVDGDAPAAMRYTESRLEKAAMELLRDLDKETVDFGTNYDDSLQEPTVLPARYPNLLVNGSAGIAVGMATNIPPHNLGEVIDAATMMIDNPEVTVDELMVVMPGPDFPTSGAIMGTDGIKTAYETGRGSIIVRGKAHIETTTTKREKLIITEIPYQLNKENLLIKIHDLVKEKKIIDISALRDESDRKGMRIVVEIKKGADPNVVLNQLFKFTQLQQSFGIIMLALVDGVPKVLSLPEILKEYIAHQQSVIRRRTEFELRKAKERAHLLEGYVIALDNIDAVIKVIRESYDDAKQRLMDAFTLSEIQATAILEMQLRRLQGLEREKIETELAELRERIAYYEKVLGDESMILQIIKDEMAEIREKFAHARRTTIGGDARILEKEDLIAEEDMIINVTQAGYIKRLPVATYRQQKRGGKGMVGVKLKDNDEVVNMFVASTHDHVLFFSTKGKVYRLKVHDLPLGTRTSRGKAIVNLLPFEPGERFAAVINTKDFPEDEYLLFATSNGMVKKTDLKAYSRVHSGGIIAISLMDNDELISVRRVKHGEKVIMVSSAGKAVLFDEEQARPMGRDTRGVKGMTVKDGAHVLGMEIAPEKSQLFVVTERGFGKRTCINEYPIHNRGGQGVKTIVMTAKRGQLVAMKIVDETHELMLMSEEGITIRVKAKDISLLGRSTQGVKVMNVGDSDRVSAVARVSGTKKESKKDREKDGEMQASLLDGEADLPEELIAEDLDVAESGEAELPEDSQG